MSKKFVLCYVEGCWAYFTSQKLKDQWGDDWDDRPYEHNAGSPYEDHNNPPAWKILKVAWDGDFETPCETYLNSPYSVQEINAGVIAWLRPVSQNEGFPILAGTSLKEFERLIVKSGGSVYKTDSLLENQVKDLENELLEEGNRDQESGRFG